MISLVWLKSGKGGKCVGVIQDYLKERREKEKDEIKKEKFLMETWIPEKAKVAKQLSLATHIGKFSHPDAQVMPITQKYPIQRDGYLHSSNIDYAGLDYQSDAFGNAAALGVFDFLFRKMSDGRSVFSHLEEDTEEIRLELEHFKENYQEIRENFLAIKKCPEKAESDERIRQVYFPIGDGQYHLLSILTPSLPLRLLKLKRDEMSRSRLAAKDRKSEEYGSEWAEIYDLTEIGFGGTKPQNISALNMKNGGKAVLFASAPPTIKNRSIVFPRKDFFANTLKKNFFRKDFQYLHKLFICERNNMPMRDKIKRTIQCIIDEVLCRVYQIRSEKQGWSQATIYDGLPRAQKIWLDDIYIEVRRCDNEWMLEISSALGRWILQSYEKLIKEDRFTMGEAELVFFKKHAATAIAEAEGKGEGE